MNFDPPILDQQYFENKYREAMWESQRESSRRSNDYYALTYNTFEDDKEDFVNDKISEEELLRRTELRFKMGQLSND